MPNMNVLWAAISYAGKAYALDAWGDAAAANLAAYRERYPEAKTDALIVDNTRNSDGYAKLVSDKGIRVIKVTPTMHFESTAHLCWQIIHQEAIIEDYDYIFSVEADNIPPAYTLTKLMEVMQAGQFHIVTHVYPFHLLGVISQGRNRTTNPFRYYYNELGLCLMTRKVLSYGLADYSRYDNFTNALFHSVARYTLGWASSTSLIPWEDNLHLDGYEEEFTQFLAPSGDGRTNPYESLPDLEKLYGQRLPECIREDYEKMGGAEVGALKMADGTYEAVAEGTVIHGGNGKVKSSAGRARKRGTRPKVEAKGSKV